MTAKKSGGPSDDVGFEGFGDAFNYEAFEEHVEDEVTDPSVDVMPPELVDEPPRRTFDRNLVPKGDAAFTARTLGPFRMVSIRGRMNESFPAEAIQKELRGPSVIDLRDVDRVSSFGVRGWLQVLQKAQTDTIYLSHCSDAIVNQITMMRNFCGRARIHSFLAPYSCESCGADFGVLYHAVQDRVRIEGRRPAEVPCPECGEATEMDEDPFTYFDLVDHLVEDGPPELERAIDALDDTKRAAPIEIELDGGRTAVRFNEAVNGTTRFNRVFNNVEGAITVDLRSAPSMDDVGADAMIEALSRLDSSISDVRIEGSPDPLTRRLIERRLERVQIRSLMTPMTDPLGGITRPALVDLEQHAPDLAAGRALSLPLPWAKGQVTPADAALVARVLMAPPQHGLTTPPAPVAQTPPASTESPTMPVAAAAAAVPTLAIILVVFLLGAVLTLGTAALYLSTNRVVPPAPNVATAPAEVGPWSTGGSLPPAWAEIPSRDGGDGSLLIVGRGTGATVEEAAANARRRADEVLATRIEAALKGSPVAGGLPPLEASTVLSANLADLGLMRTDEAVKRGENIEVAAQYKVSNAALDTKIKAFTDTIDFRGFAVAPNPPWQPRGLRVIGAQTWFTNVSIGDPVLRVGSVPVIDLDAFKRETEKAWPGVAAGGTLDIVILHGGAEATVPVIKPGAVPQTARPAPAVAPPRPRTDAPELLGLDD